MKLNCCLDERSKTKLNSELCTFTRLTIASGALLWSRSEFGPGHILSFAKKGKEPRTNKCFPLLIAKPGSYQNVWISSHTIFFHCTGRQRLAWKLSA